MFPRSSVSHQSPLSALSLIQNEELNRLARGSASPKGWQVRLQLPSPGHVSPSRPRLGFSFLSLQKTIRSIRSRRRGKSGLFSLHAAEPPPVQRKWLASIRSSDCDQGYYGPLYNRQAERRLTPAAAHAQHLQKVIQIVRDLSFCSLCHDREVLSKLLIRSLL